MTKDFDENKKKLFEQNEIIKGVNKKNKKKNAEK